MKWLGASRDFFWGALFAVRFNEMCFVLIGIDGIISIDIIPVPAKGAHSLAVSHGIILMGSPKISASYPYQGLVRKADPGIYIQKIRKWRRDKMKRNCSLEEISDGRLYTAEDLVEVSCNGCKGKASCCHGMGKSIILDPFDIHRMTTNLKLPFEALLKDRIELNLVDGVILPNLKMTGTDEGCSFLNPGGRCNIHAFRPGICRIFPLGRYYRNNSFTYILQKNECRNTSETKMKVGKWIDTPEQEKNDRFLIGWHYFLNDVEVVVRDIQDEALVKNLNMYLLNRFYFKPYDQKTDFYGQFLERLEEAKGIIKLQGG